MACPRKLNLQLLRKFLLIAVANVMPELRPFLVMRSNAIRVRNTAVKKEQTIPMMSVVAKPLIGPEPKSRRITPVMTEVRLESKIAEKALL